jgi:hypothetical protein
VNDNLRDLKDAILHMFVKRFHGRGAPPPRLSYSDLCCDDRAIMAEIMEEFYCLTGQKCIVENAVIELFDDVSLPPLEFPRGIDGLEILPHVVSDHDAAVWLQSMKGNGIKLNDKLLFGFDLEWRPFVTNPYVLNPV